MQVSPLAFKSKFAIKVLLLEQDSVFDHHPHPHLVLIAVIHLNLHL